jgi:hypothetical protein
MRGVEVERPAHACFYEGARRLIGDRRRVWPGDPLDDDSDLRADQVAHAPDNLAV